MKKQTVMCDGVKVTIGYDEETDRAESLILDIGSLTPKAITDSIEILVGILELGQTGERNAEDK